MFMAFVHDLDYYFIHVCISLFLTTTCTLKLLRLKQCGWGVQNIHERDSPMVRPEPVNPLAPLSDMLPTEPCGSAEFTCIIHCHSSKHGKNADL